MIRYFTCEGDKAWVERSKLEYVSLEKYIGIHPGGHDEPTSTYFKADGFKGKVTITKDPKKDELDNILETFLNKGEL